MGISGLSDFDAMLRMVHLMYHFSGLSVSRSFATSLGFLSLQTTFPPFVSAHLSPFIFVFEIHLTLSKSQATLFVEETTTAVVLFPDHGF